MSLFRGAIDSAGQMVRKVAKGRCYFKRRAVFQYTVVSSRAKTVHLWIYIHLCVVVVVGVEKD